MGVGPVDLQRFTTHPPRPFDGQQFGCAGPGSETLRGDTFLGPMEQPRQAEVELDF